MSQINFANTQFAKFVNYANSLPNASESKAIVAAAPGNADGEKPLADRNIVPKEGDYVGKIRRNQTLKDMNNEVRTLFKDAVAKMFGGENNIPASVKSAMKLGDYGKGKPLTARRIIAVNNAIEKLKVESFTFADAFTTGDYADEMKMKAENAGHVATDFPKLSKGANLLAKATGMPLRSALLEVMDKSSAAYAAVQFGPLYTGSVADFKKGMEIQTRSLALKSEAETLAAKAVGSGDPKDYARIARIRVDQLAIARQQVEKLFSMQNAVDKTNAEYTALMRAFDEAASDLEQAALDVENGLLKTEKDRYGRIVANDKFGNLSPAFSAFMPAIHKKRANGDAQVVLAVLQGIKNVSETWISAARDGLNDAFRKAFSERETPRLTKLMHDAEEKGNFKLPQQFYGLIGTQLHAKIYDGVKDVEIMAARLATDGSTVLFSTDQKNRLKKIVAEHVGKDNAAKIVEHFAAEVETTCCRRALNGTWEPERIENLVKHFEKYPGLAKGFDIGFKEDMLDEVKLDLKHVMTDNFNAAMRPDANDMTSLKSGLMPQSTREYNTGVVTFNGQNIPDGTTGKPYYAADSNSRRGFCEFLESKFDDNHVQMRRLVSFACGMADGLGGAISTGAFTGNMPNNEKLVKSPPRTSDYYLKDCRGFIQPGQRDPRENYDISIDEKTGDVTIKLTHYENNCFAYYLDDKGSIVDFDMGSKNSASMATTRIDVTMVIKNKSDDVLGDKIPDFNITEIKQEVV